MMLRRMRRSRTGTYRLLLVLHPHPEHHYRRCRTGARDVGGEDVPAQRALDPEVAGHLVNQVALDRIDLVVTDIALVVHRAVGEFSDGGKPAAEIVIDLAGVEVRQHTRRTWQRGLVDRCGGIEPDGSQRRRGPGQRARGEQALQRAEPRIDIIARGVADRYFPREQPGEFEGGAAPDIAAAGIAVVAAAVEPQIA